MNRLLTSVVVGFLSFAFGASVFAMEFSGDGQWKTNKGDSGAYTSSLKVDAQGDDLVISQEVKWGTEVKAFQFTIRRTDDTFFKVIVGADTLGGGYCWPVGGSVGGDGLEGGQLCHYTLKTADGTCIEESLHITADAISIMGSKWVPSAKLAISWLGRLKSAGSDAKSPK